LHNQWLTKYIFGSTVYFSAQLSQNRMHRIGRITSAEKDTSMLPSKIVQMNLRRQKLS